MKASLNLKEIKKKITSSKEGNGGEGPVVGGRPGKKNLSARTSHVPNQNSRRNVMFVKRKAILEKKNCGERKKKLKDKENDFSDAIIASYGYESLDVLSLSIENNAKEWILDSECSLHMNLDQVWFDAYKEIDGEKVLVGNNVAYKILRLVLLKSK